MGWTVEATIQYGGAFPEIRAIASGPGAPTGRGGGTMIDPVATPLSGLESLLEAIHSVPIPGAPPRLSKDGAAVGLAFLDIALRQNHIRRLTERLTLVEHRTASCTMEVDVSLGMLDLEQRQAGLLYQRIRSRGTAEPPEGPDEPDVPENVLWVPVSLARRSHAPVDIVDGAGTKLPRLTQYETSRLMASAMYRLFRLILSSQPEASPSGAQGDPQLRAFLFEHERPRWLLQAALVTLLTERNKPSAAPLANAHEQRGRAVGTTADARCREQTATIFKKYTAALAEYAELLDIVVNDYLLVVALDPRKDEHLLAFDAPLHIERRSRRSPTRLLRMATGPYWVRYQTKVPATLRAYHLVAQTEAGLEIDTMSLLSDADQSTVTSLSDDLIALGERLKRKGKRANDRTDVPKTELELQATLRRLSEVLRRRRWEASRANRSLAAGLKATRTLAEVVRQGGAASGRRALPYAGLYDLDAVTSTNLTRAANELADQELHYDFSVETEPPSTRAHVYWRRDPSRVVTARGINISANIFIRDASEQRSGNVAAFVLGVVAVAYLVGCLRVGSIWPFGDPFPYGWRWPWFDPKPVTGTVNGEAMIAVLLLLPGFLYTRLRLPHRHTIADHMRRLPRIIAHIAIAAALGLAAVLAATENRGAIETALALAIVVPLIAIALVPVASWGVRREFLPLTRDTPAWVRRSRRTRPSRLPRWLLWRPLLRAPDSHFGTDALRPDPTLGQDFRQWLSRGLTGRRPQ
jgi:hypothetical protein